jgi:hypothetical protein
MEIEVPLPYKQKLNEAFEMGEQLEHLGTTNVILPVVVYGCETWSLTLREEHRLRTFANWVLREVFGPKRDKVKGEWRQLHNKELSDHYCSPNIVRVIKSRRMRWVGHVACMEEMGGVCRVVVGKSDGKRPLGIPRRGWLDNIKMDLQEVGCEGMDWIDLAQERDRCRALMNVVMKLRIAQDAGNFLTSWGTVSFSRRNLLHAISQSVYNSLPLIHLLNRTNPLPPHLFNTPFNIIIAFSPLNLLNVELNPICHLLVL